MKIEINNFSISPSELLQRYKLKLIHRHLITYFDLFIHHYSAFYYSYLTLIDSHYMHKTMLWPIHPLTHYTGRYSEWSYSSKRISVFTICRYLYVSPSRSPLHWTCSIIGHFECAIQPKIERRDVHEVCYHPSSNPCQLSISFYPILSYLISLHLLSCCTSIPSTKALHHRHRRHHHHLLPSSSAF